MYKKSQYMLSGIKIQDHTVYVSCEHPVILDNFSMIQQFWANVTVDQKW